jgi:hypothetical protein
MPDIAHTADNVVFPSPYNPPCSLLPVHTNGLRCTASVRGEQCLQVCITVRKIQEHCKTQHGWENCQKRGGNMRVKSVHSTNRMWDEGQAYQQFFSAPGWKRNTPVYISPSLITSAQSGVGQGELEQHADQLIEEREAAIKSLRQHQIIDGSLDRLEPTPWLRFTAWHQHLAGFDREQLLLSIRPADDEASEASLASLTIEEDGEVEGLGKACRATRRLIRQAFSIARVHIVGRAALEAVNCRETGAKSNERPFYAEQQVKTIRKYS